MLVDIAIPMAAAIPFAVTALWIWYCRRLDARMESEFQRFVYERRSKGIEPNGNQLNLKSFRVGSALYAQLVREGAVEDHGQYGITRANFAIEDSYSNTGFTAFAPNERIDRAAYVSDPVERVKKVSLEEYREMYPEVMNAI